MLQMSLNQVKKLHTLTDHFCITIGRFTVFVDMGRRTITFHVFEYTTIQQLRWMIEEKLCLTVGCLCYRGRELTDGDLSDWEIYGNSTLRVFPIQVSKYFLCVYRSRGTVLCSKFYLLCYAALLKFFTYYAQIMLCLISPFFFIMM